MASRRGTVAALAALIVATLAQPAAAQPENEVFIEPHFVAPPLVNLYLNDGGIVRSPSLETSPTFTDVFLNRQPVTMAEPSISAMPWTEVIESLDASEERDLIVVEATDWLRRTTPPSLEQPWFGETDLAPLIAPTKQFSYGRFVGAASAVLDENALVLEGLGTRTDFEDLALDLEPVVAANPRWGAVFATEMLENSPELLSDPDAPEWKELIENLIIAHQLRNPTATAILGESYLFGRGVVADEIQGLGYLEDAVAAGEIRAMTSLAAYGYDRESIMPREAALAFSRQALAAGDPNAAGILGFDAAAQGNFNEAVDHYTTVIGSGTGNYPEQARINLAATCGFDNVVCEPLTVAVATSRKPGSIEAGLPWLDSQSGDYATNFAFAQTMVPFESEALAGEPPPPNWLAQLGDWFQADQYSKSTFFLRDSRLVEQQAFYDGMADAIAQGEEKRILLYVHGFNNSVEDALLAVARLKQRGRLPGIPMIYSWAAGEGLARPNFENMTFYSGYSRDVQMASNSCIAFSSFLTELTERFGAGNIILVAHSHGAKLVHAALTGCEFRSEAAHYVGAPFDSVIYAAPDIDLDQFDQSFRALEGMSERVAIYVSGSDEAIKASSNLIRGGLPRLGGASRADFDAIEVIDATSITDPSKDSGHSYAFINFLALTDMRRFLNGEVAGQRCLALINQTGPGWWLRPDC